MQNADAVKRQDIRKQSKKHADFAGEWVKNLVEDIVETDQDIFDIEKKMYYKIKDTISETTCELTGEKQLEKMMKKSCVKYMN